MYSISRPSGALTIGALARAAGVHVETIRYYQRLRLISKPGRCRGSIGYYSADALARVRFIKRAQALGFSLREIAVLAALDRRHDCASAHGLAVEKLASTERSLAELKARRDALSSLLAGCGAGGSAACPILDFLRDAA